MFHHNILYQRELNGYPLRRKLLPAGLQIVLIAAVFALLLYRLYTGREQLGAVQWWAHPGYLALHLLLLLALFALLVLGWRHVAGVCGLRMSLPAAAATWLTPNLGKYIPGKVFMFAGRIELSHRLGMRRSAALTALASEHLLLTVAAVPFLGLVRRDGLELGSGAGAPVLVLLLVVAWVIVLFPASGVRLLNAVLRRLDREPLTCTPRRADMVLLLLVYGAGWVVYGASGALLAVALGLGSTLSPAAVGASFVASWMIGFLSMLTPGGLGVREAVLVLLLSPAIPGPQAVALALLARASWTLVEMGGVVLGVALARHSCR